MEQTLNDILNRYKNHGGNIITLLQETQEAFGHIPRNAISFFSEELKIAPSRFYGVATFYAQFRLKPVGRHRVTACCGTACHVKGSEKVIGGIKRELKLSAGNDTTDDGAITLEEVACLGTCSFAPVVLVDGSVRGKSSGDAIVKEIRALRKQEQSE